MTVLREDGSAVGRWHHDDGDRLVCTLCPRECSLKEGDRGFCFVRQHSSGEIVLSTYGRSTGFCIDPIEKKPLSHFLPGTAVLSFGTAGCNLGCKFCQNWDISKSREVERLSSHATPKQIAAAASQHGCHSVAMTYNDPVIWAEYAIDTALACRERGIASVAVTAGYINDPARRDFFAVMGAANVDLKAFTEEFYQKITYSHLQPVLDTISYIHHETECWLELTNLIIPGANDSPDDLQKMCDWILSAVGDSVPIHFTAFHPDFRMTDRQRTDPESLCAAMDLAKRTGIRFAYVGNVHDTDRQSTYCPDCNQLLIKRDWHQVNEYHLTPDGHCPNCHYILPGRFIEKAGTWGARRLPIAMGPMATPKAANRAETSLKNIKPPNKPRPLASLPPDPSPNPNAGEIPVSTDAKSQQTAASPTTAPPSPLQIDKLTPQHKQAVVKAAATWVAQAVAKQPIKIEPDSLGQLTQRIVMGAFVTLKRGETLRGCCGVLGKPMPLAGAITSAAQRTATDDRRFAPISPSELKHLSLEVTLLGPFQEIQAKGQERAEHITIGKHGVMIRRGKNSGLLLPSVAVENNWDATKLLQAVCSKAGLRESAWESDDAQILIFHGEPMEGEMADLLPASVPEAIAEPISKDELEAYSQLAGQNIVAISTGGTPSYVAAHLTDHTVNAIVLSMQWSRDGDDENAPRQGNALQVSFRPGVPLQSTLYQMCQRAAQMFQQERFVGELKVGLTLGFDPALHGFGQKADLEGVNTGSRAVVISDQQHCGFAFNPEKSAEELREDLRRNLPVSSRDAMLHSLHVVSTLPHVMSINAPTPVAAQGARPAAVAGKFYPAEDAARRGLVDGLLSAEAQAASNPLAIMVPHAGLKYSGKIAAQVWQSIQDLDNRTLLVISPKHTRQGVNWSVCPFDAWRLSSSCSFETDAQLRDAIAEGLTSVELDAGAHAQEHGIEVQLPLLERVAPNAKVVGMAIQGGSWEDICTAARELAAVIEQQDTPPLLVISSDMNHYASDEENRRRDRLALDALATGNPEELNTACIDNDISMCGRVPAMLVMQTLAELGLKFTVTETGYATSAESNGDKSQVVGYAGALLEPA